MDAFLPAVIEADSSTIDHGYLSIGAMVIFLMLMFYISVGIYIEQNQFTFGHEASITIILGMLISCTEWLSRNQAQLRLMKFDDNTFFYFCLPPIVFASGFNMRRAKFFNNFKSIIAFGVLGTFVSFFSFSAMTIFIKDLGILQQLNGKTGQWSSLELTSAECMLMCSLLCSSDVIAAVSLISYEQEPDLFSIVFGEGITNDAVSIILFNTVMQYTRANSHVTWSTPASIVLNFVSLGAYSIMIGVVFGLLSSYILKQHRVLSKNAVTECMVIFCFGYLSYVTSEVAEFSGIITLLTSGIVMAHYLWFNLSPQGKQSSYIVFQFLGYANEAFVFVYLGLTFFSYGEFKWSPQLFLFELIIIMIGRFFGTIGLIWLMTKCGFRSGISPRQLVFIWYAGMIRGAIAFGLVLRIDQKYKNREVIVTTSLALVVFTTVVFGSTVGVLQKCLSSRKQESLDASFAAEDNYLKAGKTGEKK